MSANISTPTEAKDSDTDNNIAHSLSSNEKVEGVHNEKSFQQQVSSSDEDLVTGSTKSFGEKERALIGTFQDPIGLKVLTSYATNGFDNHSLLSTVSVIRSVMAAASLPFFARMSDMYGRCELLLVAVLFKAIGSLIESQAYDVQRYAAGAVIDAFGQAGIKVMLRLVMSDNSKMNWRLFAISIVTCPYIINTWISGNVVTSLTDHYSWNYSIGMWAFIFPISNIPLFVCLVWTRLKLRKQEDWQELCREERESFTEMNAALEKLENRTPGGNKQFFWVSDIAGIVLFVLCIGLLLVPLTLAGGVTTKWKQAHIIAPLVVGFCMIPFFVLWELRCARHPIAPFPLLKDRGVLAAMTVGLFYKFVYLMPHDYMYPVLLVGMNATKAAATRIGSLNSFMIAVVGPLLGLIVVRVRRTKGFIISGICFWIIGTGMLYYYRGSNDGVHDKRFVDGVIGAMIIFGFGSGLFARTIDVSIQSCTDHEYMASVTGVYMAMFKIGSAFGDCVSGAMWTQRMYKEIPTKPYDFIKEHKWGTPARKAVVWAYADVQRLLCIVGLCLCVPMLLAGLCLRDHKLQNVQAMDAECGGELGPIGQAEQIRGKNYVQVNSNDEDLIFKYLKKGWAKMKGTSKA
ncbi:hypothetical protein CJJ09_003759 [Candidozyma auris]|nr:hypothetical protein CJJ09_003759 [[Candida] auris]